MAIANSMFPSWRFALSLSSLSLMTVELDVANSEETALLPSAHAVCTGTVFFAWGVGARLCVDRVANLCPRHACAVSLCVPFPQCAGVWFWGFEVGRVELANNNQASPITHHRYITIVFSTLCRTYHNP